ncbi:hypothetical protein U9M48_014209 [Paspalum notatum var. saurae]|uniref:Uncharacterized protein n=1 Tax=Paspalum notatum var. saurae TaxID=547442 RepID=A0AAQ3T2D8_PASNO
MSSNYFISVHWVPRHIWEFFWNFWSHRSIFFRGTDIDSRYSGIILIPEIKYSENSPNPTRSKPVHIYIHRNPLVVLFPELVSVFQSRKPNSLDLSGKVEVSSNSSDPPARNYSTTKRHRRNPRIPRRSSRRDLRRDSLRFARTSPVLRRSEFLLQLRV